jgi:hypothetical protein
LLTSHIYVNLKVEGLTNAVTRDVAFYIAGAGSAVVPVEFNALGEGSVQLTDATYLDAVSICATEGHTLTRTLDLTGTWGECEATANFTGDDKLLAGDLSNPPYVPQDNLVDIVDFAVLAARWNQPVDPDLGYLADVTGDGWQETADFTAIQINYAMTGDECSSTLLATPRWRVSVNELAVRNARAADLNADGMIDAKDIREFARVHHLRLTPAFRARLDRAEAELDVLELGAEAQVPGALRGR